MLNQLFTNISGSLLNSADFDANGRGEITPAQKQRLMGGTGMMLALVFPLVIFLPMLFCFFSGFISILGNVSPGDSIFAWIVPLFMGLVFLIIIGSMVSQVGGKVFGLVTTWPKLKRDQDNRAIRLGQGVLAYAKKGYIFKSGDRDLTLPNDQAGGLLPGARYNVYYLEESGVVLSAQELAPVNPSQLRNALQEILSMANNFTWDDLTQNRNGEVTSAQRAKPLGQAVLGAIFGLVAFGMGAAFFLNGRSFSGNALMAMLIPAIVLGVFMLVGGWMFVNAALDMTVSPLEQVEGEGHKEQRRSGGKNKRTLYYYVVNGVSFQVEFQAYNAFIDGQQYRIYYLPRTKKMLSLEVLGS